MKKIFVSFFLIGLIFGQKTLDNLINDGIKNNAGLQSAFNSWQSAVAEAAFAKKLPNPRLKTGIDMQSISTVLNPQEYEISLMQEFPMFGKLSSAWESMMLTAESMQHSYLQKKSELIAEIKSVYYELYFLDRSLAITRQNIQLLKNWERVIQTKYQTAQAGHADVIKTQIELMKMENDWQSLADKKEPLIAEIRSLLNDLLITTIDLPDTLEVQWVLQTKESLLEEILEKNHSLISADKTVQASEKRVQNARLNYLPDFGIGVDYFRTGEQTIHGITESGNESWMASFSLELPLWFRKIGKHVTAAKYQLKSAENDRMHMENELKTRFEHIWFGLKDSKRKIELFRNDLIPKSLESLGASEKAYISDKADLITLIDAQRRLLQFNLEYEKAVVGYMQEKSRLDALLGL